MTDAQWSARPSGEPWSPAETVEHVVLTDRATLARLGRIGDAPPPPDTPRLADEQIVEAMFHGRPAPPGLAEPTGELAHRLADGVAALTSVRDGVVACVAAAGGLLRDRSAPHPVFGAFDGVQWILFLATHTDNHVPQLHRLRSALGLPTHDG